MKDKTKANYHKREKGAVLLMAILVSGVALAVGFGVYNRTYKELLFASFWKQTQVAFAAADEGLECAMYWDTRVPLPLNGTCFGTAITWTPGAATPATGYTMTTTTGCVNIRITKNAIAPFTTIESRGYNTCNSSDPRRVERGLGVQY